MEDVRLAKRRVRVAGRALTEVVDGIKKRYEARPTFQKKSTEVEKPPPKEEEEDEDAAWGDVERCLGLVDALTKALKEAAKIDASRPPVVQAAHLSRSSRRPEAPAELVSLTELAATHTALELASGWGVAAVCDSRPLTRDWSRAAKIPIKAQRRLKKRPDLTPAEALRRRTRLLETFAGVMRHDTLAPVAPRFATDLVALALHAFDAFDASMIVAEEEKKESASSILESLPAPWVARSARILLSSTQSADTRRRCAAVLGVTARRSVLAVLDEFAGDDELSAETGGDAPLVVERVAAALAAPPPGTQDLEYVRDVAPQLVAVALSDDAPRANVAKATLAKFAETRHSHQRDAVLEAIAGNLKTHAAGDLLHFARFAKLVPRDAVGFAGSVFDEDVVASLWCVAVFAATRGRARDLADAAAALAAFAAGAGADALAKALDDSVFRDSEECPTVCPTVSTSLETGGLRFVVLDKKEVPPSFSASDKEEEPNVILSATVDEGEAVASVLRAIESPAVVGALFATTLRSHLLRRKETMSLKRIRVAAQVAELLDTGAIETSGVSILEAIGAVLEARARTVSAVVLHNQVTEDDAEDEEEDACMLEQMALATLLAVLTVGTQERREDAEEAALRATLPALETLAAPARARQELAHLASECWIRVLTRGGDKAPDKAPDKADDSPIPASGVAGDWREALAAAREALRNASPAERARAIVSVTKFARAVTRGRDDAHARASRVRLLEDDDDDETPALPTARDWQPVAAACVEALGDDESYVYLAAAHSLAALADANPLELMPFLTSREALESVEPRRRGRAEARIAEALSCAIRRRGDAAPAYVKQIGRRLVMDARPTNDDARGRCAAFANLADLVAQAKFALQPIALDLVDLVLATLTLESKLVSASTATLTAPGASSFAQRQSTKNDVVVEDLDAEEEEEAEEKEAEPPLRNKDRSLEELQKKAVFTFSPRRAAAFLGCRLLQGSAQQCIEAAPRPTARMCKQLAAVSADLAEDKATRVHATAALDALDACLTDLTAEPSTSGRADKHGLRVESPEDLLPMFRQNWLADTNPNRFDFIQELNDVVHDDNSRASSSERTSSSSSS